MIRKTLLAMTLLAATAAAHAVPLLTEDFDDISTLTAKGWLTVNNSSPGGETSWFQGNPGIFDAQSGAASSYIGANYLNAGFGDISNWLISPELTLSNGDELAFYTRSAGTFADRLEVRLSQSGSSVGSTPGDVGDFTTLLLTINPGLDVGASGYPDAWTAYNVTIAGVTSGLLGRFAFRYAVTDTWDNGDYIGIDSVIYGVPDSVPTSVPEPGTLALFAAGVLGMFLMRRRHMSNRARSLGLGLAAAAMFSASASAEPPAAPTKDGLMSFPNVRVVAAPAAPAAKPAAATPGAGMRAAVDSQGRLRELTAEEAQQLAPARKTAVTAGPARRGATIAEESTDEGGTTLYGPGNTVGMTLGEEAMNYQVARKTPEGLEVQEYRGKAAAERAVHGSQKKENEHAH